MLEGNPGRRPLNKTKVIVENKIPKCPDTLTSPVAQKEWRRMARLMGSMGLLTALDLRAFEGYCSAYARWIEAEEFISKHGMVYKTPKGMLAAVPHVQIAAANLRLVREFSNEFGLTPSSRSRMNTSSGNDDDDDLMASLLRGKD